MAPGVKAEFPQNLFNTWLDYHEARGNSRADMIRTANEMLGRNYDNNSFFKWKKQRTTVSELVVINFIYPELPAVLQWLFEQQGYPTKGVDFEFLAAAVRPAVKLTTTDD